MKAYIVNETEFIAAFNPAEAAAIHWDMCHEEEIEVKVADITTPWSEDGELEPSGTLADALTKATRPSWMGSTEI